MKLLSVGKFVQKTEYRENIQDYKTWTAMSQYFDKIYIIVQSPDDKYHHQKCEKLDITWIPKANKFFDFFYFIIKSLSVSLKLVRKNNIDILNVGEPICAGLMAIWLKRKVMKPLVVQLQGQFFNLPNSYSYVKRLLIKHIARYVAKKADRVRVVSEEIKRSAIENGVEESRIIVSPSRCDTDTFNAEHYIEDSIRIREELGCAQGDILLVFVGRLIPAKDVDSILKAMPMITKRHHNVRLLIVGDGELAGHLRNQLNMLKIEEYVTFYGAVTYNEVPKMLAAGDIFVSPSLDEGMPRAVLEAMSMGLASVVTPVGGNSEIIEDCVNGCFVEVKNPKQIAEKVNHLIDNPVIMNRIRKNARKRIIDKYEFNKCIEGFAKIHFI